MATLWIRIEGEPTSVKFYVKRQQSELNIIDLADICPELCKKEPLRGVNPDSLEFFRYSDRITPLLPDTLINTLNTTAADPLVVRYPLSNDQGKDFLSILLHLQYTVCIVLMSFFRL
jgi:hypothetical protein